MLKNEDVNRLGQTSKPARRAITSKIKYSRYIWEIPNYQYLSTINITVMQFRTLVITE